MLSLRVVLSPERVLDKCSTRRVSETYFHTPAHARIFSRLVEMREKKLPIDLISVTQFLEDRRVLAEVGGAATVTDLFTFVPTATTALYYLELLREKFLLRKVITAGTGFAARPLKNTARCLNFSTKWKRGKIGEDQFGTTCRSIRELSMEALDTIDQLYQRRGSHRTSHRLLRFDKLTNGLQPGERIVIAARPSWEKPPSP
jgi:replicative DNA helicase